MEYSDSKYQFAKSEKEAGERFEKYKSNDPFPKIEPALLNSEDFINYIAVTGMIYPFDCHEDFLKSASYAVKLEGTCIYWNDKKQQQTQNIVKGKPFTLEKNSIAFVTLEPTFRIPDYVALRFNLKIKYVYSGLLLGTGPLVDPGFEGKLSIPLHNLTTNDYELEGGKTLIWFEFTKLSKNKRWDKQQPFNLGKDLLPGKYYSFPSENTKRSNVTDYLLHATGGEPVRSSISGVMITAQQNAKKAQGDAKKSQESAEKAQKDAEKVHKESKESAIKFEQIRESALNSENQIRKFTTFGYLALAVATITIVITLVQVWQNNYELVKDTNIRVNEANILLFESKREIQTLKEKVLDLEKKFEEYPPALELPPSDSSNETDNKNSYKGSNSEKKSNNNTSSEDANQNDSSTDDITANKNSSP